ncbi:unnamed protein product [Phaedon cochleariae]|uniref:Uncharacterized protein n=1 Tax=Phaedon cochleariae TaxID=80249 RepID=A0A9N9WY66_PHACE|nr:unnamed protein product [Phaedon cochleariae]
MRPLRAEQSKRELKQSLTGFEKELAEKMCMVEITGKRGEKVPVSLTPDVKQAIHLLIQTRNIVGVSKNNPYSFAKSGTNLEYMGGHECLRKCCPMTYEEAISAEKIAVASSESEGERGHGKRRSKQKSP